MDFATRNVPEQLKSQLVQLTSEIIKCVHETHKDLGPGMPMEIYQDALTTSMKEHGIRPEKDYRYYPLYHGDPMKYYLKMDLLVQIGQSEDESIIIQCKAKPGLTEQDRYEMSGYLRGTEYPIALLINFGTWPEVQIQRYFYDRNTKLIYSF